MFASQSRARAVNLRIALSTTKKGNMSVSDYYSKMKGYSDEMAAAGRRIDDEELVEHILTGLNPEFESVVSALVARVEPVSLDELYSQLLSFETRMELYRGPDQSSANMAGRGRGNFGRGRGNDSNTRQGGQGYTNKRSFNNDRLPLCQVCFKRGHTAVECWHRFDEDYTPDEKHTAAAATNSYNVDTNWYVDTGSTVTLPATWRS